MSTLTPALNARVARDIVAGFLAAGVTHAVVSPGSRNTPILLALAEASVQMQVVLDERAAGFVALGLSRVLGRPVVLSCTSGSAAANYLPAVVESYHGRHPLLVVTADRPEELQGRGAPQTMRQTELYGEFAEASAHISAPRSDGDCEDVLRIARQLGEVAVERQGPVHLNVGFREPLWTADVTLEALGEVPKQPALEAPVSVMELPANMRSARGLLVCGPDTAAGPAEREVILRLGETLGWPVLAEASSGVRFGPDHPNLITTYDALMRSPDARDLAPECVVRFGRTNTSRPLNEWLRDVADNRLIAVDPSPFPSDPDHLATTHIQTRAVDFCQAALDDDLNESLDAEWLPRWRRADRILGDLFEREVNESWWEGAIARTVLETAPEHAAVHLANSMPIRDVDSFCPAGGRHLRVFSNRGVNGIDGTLATVAGEALALGGRPVIALVGDLALLHDAGSLALLRDARATVVVVDNGGGGIFEFLPIAAHRDHFETLFITPQQTSIESVVLGYGAKTTRVTSLDALRQALAADVERDGLGVIIAEVSREENVARHRAIWARAVSALEGSS